MTQFWSQREKEKALAWAGWLGIISSTAEAGRAWGGALGLPPAFPPQEAGLKVRFPALRQRPSCEVMKQVAEGGGVRKERAQVLDEIARASLELVSADLAGSGLFCSSHFLGFPFIAPRMTQSRVGPGSQGSCPRAW